MEKISTKREFVDKLKDLRAVELTARSDYEKDVIAFKNFEIVQDITKIKKDEDRHIQLIEEMISSLDEN